MKRYRDEKKGRAVVKRAKANLRSVDVVFDQFGIINDHIAPFLDEWTFYNFVRVGKKFSRLLEFSVYNKDRNYSILSLFFKRHNTCCICFGHFNPQHAEPVYGLYCHKSCVPTIGEWEVRQHGLYLTKKSTSLGSIFRGFEFKNPCFVDQGNTLSYHLQRNYPTSHKIFTQGHDNNILKKYQDYFNNFYKSVALRLPKTGYNIDKKVNLGGLRVSLTTIFDMVYPGFYSTHDAPAIVEKYKCLDEKLSDIHNMVMIYYSTHIRPKLLTSLPWGKFLKSKMCWNVCYTDTLVQVMHEKGCFEQPERLYGIMDQSVMAVRRHQVSQHVECVIGKYNRYIACDCQRCAQVARLNWSSFITQATDVFCNDISIKGEDIREYVWSRMEIYYKFWSQVNLLDTIQKTDVVRMPMLFVKRSVGDMESVLTLCATLLRECYNGQDIYASILAGKETRDDIENYIARRVRNRQTCYCGRKRNSLDEFCTKHNLCMYCCMHKPCIEESQLFEFE